MDRLQGPINPFEIRSDCYEAEAVSSSCNSGMELSYNTMFTHHQNQQQMTFLQLLHGAIQDGSDNRETEEDEKLQPFMLESPYQAQHSNFQLLLQLQSQGMVDVECCRAAEQLESCITHVSESEVKPEALVTEDNQQQPLMAIEKALRGPMRAPMASVPRERKRRKRSRVAAVAAVASKSAEEVESQRMTHINVERNRRRLMNDHLASLRSLMPPSYVQRGDQASIVGGAIEYVKELEQHLIALEATKRRRTNGVETNAFDVGALHHEGIGFFVSPQYTYYLQSHRQLKCRRSHEVKEEVKDEEGEISGGGVDVEATVVQGHVNLKVVAARRRGQIARVILALDELRLSVLHLNITTLDRFSVLYSFNLKMEEDCKLGSADEIATAVQHIFSYINAR